MRRMSSRVMCVKSEILHLPFLTLLNSAERTLKKKKSCLYEKQTEAHSAVTLAVVIRRALGACEGRAKSRRRQLSYHVMMEMCIGTNICLGEQ